MRTVLRIAPAAVAALLLAAHFFRAGEGGLVAVSLATPLLLALRRGWVPVAVRGMLLAGAAVWVETAYRFIAVRQALGQPWVRLALILGTVALFTALAAWPLGGPRIQARFAHEARRRVPCAAAFLLTFGLLGTVIRLAPWPMLLVDRFIPGFGWFEAFVLAVYAAWVAGKLLDRTQIPRWRGRIWGFFSFVFFGQLALGLAGFDRFLMTGTLHAPVPALIVAGPVYRGEGFFMLILFAVTILFVGPAWCSHLCYVGAWDNAFAKAQTRPTPLPRWRHALRLALLALSIGIAYALRRLGVGAWPAAGVALAFGLFGVALMVFWSRRTGAMTHCVAYCPIGLLATTAGKISPFRLRIGPACSGCNACTLTCRYDALSEEDVARGRPGSSCTLCGDCLSSCRGDLIEYRFLWLSPLHARALFVVLVSAFHAAFVGVARI